MTSDSNYITIGFYAIVVLLTYDLVHKNDGFEKNYSYFNFAINIYKISRMALITNVLNKIHSKATETMLRGRKKRRTTHNVQKAYRDF